MRDTELAQPSRHTLLVALLAAIVIAALSFGVAWQQRAGEPPERKLAYVYPEAVAPHSAAATLKLIDMRVAGEGALIDPASDDWLSRAAQAGRLMARARLSGDFADHAAAGAMIEDAAARGSGQSGPHLGLAAWYLSIHRLGPAAAALDVIARYPYPPGEGERAEAQAMRGDIAFYRGNYAGALAAWKASGGGVGRETRRALYDAKTGNAEQALSTLNAGLRTGRFITAQEAANLRYQRGLIELHRGNWSVAETEFGKADALFGGYWPFVQARAQMHAVRGDVSGAVALYTRAIDVAGNPETMDALAAFYRAQGDRPNADLWAKRAGAIWDRWLTLLPEAAYAHALEHELAFGSPQRALALAQANNRARPYGASTVALGWALLANGRAAEAARLIDALNATVWNTAEQHVVASRAHALLGDSDKADAARKAALALNPRVFDSAAGMIWIGH